MTIIEYAEKCPEYDIDNEYVDALVFHCLYIYVRDVQKGEITKETELKFNKVCKILGEI